MNEVLYGNDEGRKDWIVRWTDRKFGVSTKLTLAAKTEDEAIAVASSFGWTKPKWWQWWRRGDSFVDIDI